MFILFTATLKSSAFERTHSLSNTIEWFGSTEGVAEENKTGTTVAFRQVLSLLNPWSREGAGCAWTAWKGEGGEKEQDSDERCV